MGVVLAVIVIISCLSVRFLKLFTTEHVIFRWSVDFTMIYRENLKRRPMPEKNERIKVTL